MSYVLLSAAVLLNVAAYAIFRVIALRPHDLLWTLHFGFGLALGAANVFCFTAALKQLNLSVAYPIFSGATIGLIVLIATLFFGERLTASAGAGGALVVVGIWLLSRA